MGVPAGAQIPLVLVGADDIVAKRATDWSDTIRRMARLSAITTASEAPAQSVQLPVRGSLAALPLDGVIDFAAETARLKKEIGRLEGDEAKIKAKLGNEDFMRWAPDDVVEEQRDRLAECESRRGTLQMALSRLGD